MAKPKTAHFTGSGQSGVPIDETTSVGAKIDFIVEGLSKPFFRFGPDWDPDRDNPWCDSESPLHGYCNPGDHSGDKWSLKLSPAERVAQADKLLGHNVARSDLMDLFLRHSPAFSWVDDTIKDEILDAPTLTRKAYIEHVAPRYDLEPELISGIILTEQRDQSEAEDIADFYIAHNLFRDGSSVGLGQVRVKSAIIYELLSSVIDLHVTFTPTVALLLVDEALNINATARYVRLLANAGARVESHQRNEFLEKDPDTCGDHIPSDGRYVRSNALEDLSVLASHSSNWSVFVDPRLASEVTVPAGLASPEFTADRWRWNRNYYYLRVIGMEYTSCPFDPEFLKKGVTRFEKQGTNWRQKPDPDGFYEKAAWALLLPMAFEDCKQSFAP